MTKKLISIVTPCLNEEDNVRPIYEKIKLFFSENKEYEYEHIFIDNKSTDNTREVLRKLSSQDQNVKIIFNTRNYGQWASPYYALQQSSGEAAVLIVADLQDPPELIKEFIKYWEEGYKTVIGIKKDSDGNKLSFYLRKIFYKLINKFSDIELFENFMGFGLYDKEVINILRKFNEPEPYLRGIIADINFKVKKVKYTHKKRLVGKTKNNIISLVNLGLVAFTSYSKFPLRIISIFAFLFAIISLTIGVFYTVYKLLFWDTFATGTAPLILIISVFFSLTFIFLGIIAEYINSINTSSKTKPLVIEEERINFENRKKNNQSDN